MKITQALIDKLIILRRGDSLPSSAMRGEWVEELLHEGVLISRSQGSRRTLLAANPSSLESSLASVDERLADLGRMRDILTGDSSRAEQAAETGNSKLVSVRSCHGFMVNSYEPILCKLHGQSFVVQPQDGSMIFVSDWEYFEVPSDVIVVGIENMENFRQIRKQYGFFLSEISDSAPLLFVSRYPQSADLRRWLCGIPNRYVHFGDFDLAGINIFITEFQRYLGERASFLIPTDIESRLINGSAERYKDQWVRFRNLTCADNKVQHLIDLINKYRKGYDQEGYIKK